MVLVAGIAHEQRSERGEQDEETDHDQPEQEPAVAQGVAQGGAGPLPRSRAGFGGDDDGCHGYASLVRGSISP